MQSGTAEILLSEIAVLKSKTTEMEKECKCTVVLTYLKLIHRLVLLKMQQCNKYKSELIHFRRQAGLSTDDIPLDEGYF